MSLSILLYEDNDSLRESISTMLSLTDRFRVSGSFANVLSVTDDVQKHNPDAVLMDIDMPGMTGIEAVKKIRATGSGIPIIMLTVFDDNRNVFDAICSGASGYLLKKHISSKLFDAIEEVMSGGAPMSPSIARMVVASMQPATPNPYQLTPREKDVLKSLAQGNSYKLIAAEYEISVDTVRTHLKKVYEKLQVHSQTEAVSKAINERLV
ncbi:MAG TPA: response regulator transcription factor [Cyclobacteriaceae bacterium]|nr:response regulator transcription factor [Cyclobacteriaceae bacterium]